MGPHRIRAEGTDPDGYDELGRLMAGGQVSLELGIAAAIVATVIGTLWGAAAGYFGGALDTVMMRIVDAALARRQERPMLALRYQDGKWPARYRYRARRFRCRHRPAGPYGSRRRERRCR